MARLSAIRAATSLAAVAALSLTSASTPHTPVLHVAQESIAVEMLRRSGAPVFTSLQEAWVAADVLSLRSDVDIQLHGRIQAGAPIVMAPTPGLDADAARHTVTVRTAPGEVRAVVSGGVAVTGWAYNSSSGMWTAPLPAGVAYSQSFIVDGALQTRARSPNAGSYYVWADTFPAPFGNKAFVYAGNDVSASWYDLNNVQFKIYFAWTASLQYVADVFEDNNTVTFTNPSNWPIGAWPISGASGGRYWVDNLREGLDSVGEWYLDNNTRTLSYMAPPGWDMNVNHTAVVPTMVTVLTLANRTNVAFTDVTIGETDWDCPPTQMCDAQSATWQGNAAVEVQASSGVTFSDVEFRSVGHYALWVHLGSTFVTVDRCKSSEASGGCGVGSEHGRA
jgi:hypothetical protein